MNKLFDRKLKVDKIKLIRPNEIEKYRKVGFSDGRKTDHMPNLVFSPPKRPNMNTLNLKNLGATNFSPPPLKPDFSTSTRPPTPVALSAEKDNGIFYKYQKEKIIPANKEHEAIKSDVFKNLQANNIRPSAANVSSYNIRIERPQGVSEDQLNSDEKAFYSFYKRSYSQFVSSIFASYEKIRIEKPGIDQDLEDKHVLIGKIDYDENGDIITIKILKSSESDNIHYFFEEALKNLKIPNPPKIFFKQQKEFTVYYQIQIN